MSDSDISNLNSSIFTKTTGRTIVIGLVTQYTRNFQTRQGKRIIPRPASIIPVNHSCLPDNSENASQLLAPIFLANLSQRSIKNAVALTCVSKESVHRAMGIKDNDGIDR